MSQQINLFNPIFLKQEKHFSARTMAQALGVITLALLAFWGFAYHQVRSLQALGADSERSLVQLRQQLTTTTAQYAAGGRSKLLEAELVQLEAQVKARRELLALLASGELGNVEGFARYFAAFARQPVSGVWLTGFSVSGGELVVQGRVLHPGLVPAYIRALNEEQVMRGRQVTELKLTAREDAPKPPAVAPSAPGTTPVPPAVTPVPQRYVEFSFSAPLVAPEPPKPAGGTS